MLNNNANCSLQPVGYPQGVRSSESLCIGPFFMPCCYTSRMLFSPLALQPPTLVPFQDVDTAGQYHANNLG